MEKEGKLRLLTPGEVRMARAVFGDSIEYHKVWVHHDSYFPFGLQPENAEMAPNGELYFRAWYTDDFSVSDLPHRHIFIHDNVSCMATRQRHERAVERINKQTGQLSLYA